MKANHNLILDVLFHQMVGFNILKEQDESKSQPHEMLHLFLFGWF